MDYQEIIKNAIDLHVHVGPEIIPRKFTIAELQQQEKGNLLCIGVKNHFFPTVTMASEKMQGESPSIIHSVTLNYTVGGFNTDAVRASAELASRPIIVWFPTIHAENFLKKRGKEIPAEWFGANKKASGAQSMMNMKGLSIFEGTDTIRPEVLQVLDAIKSSRAILATGHISWQESQALVRCAAKCGITKMIVTHPIYQPIDMPLTVQQELADLGAYIEHCYSMFAIDKISMRDIALQIKGVGVERCIISSDVGQVFSKNPSEALVEFAELLYKEGIPEKDIATMLIKNPGRLIAP